MLSSDRISAHNCSSLLLSIISDILLAMAMTHSPQQLVVVLTLLTPAPSKVLSYRHATEPSIYSHHFPGNFHQDANPQNT